MAQPKVNRAKTVHGEAMLKEDVNNCEQIMQSFINIYYIYIYILYICMHYVLSPAWLCKPVDCSPPGISILGTLQVRIMEWVAISSSRVSSWPRDWTCISYVSCIVGGLLTLSYSITKLCWTLCYPMDYSTPGFPVLHYLQEFAQTHVHWVSDAIQPSHPLLPLYPPTLNLSQHQGLFQWVRSSH